MEAKGIKYMKIESNVFIHNGKIPTLYTCDGESLRPPLKILNVPEEAKSLALIMDDPDAPNGDFVHWLVWNIDSKTEVIESDSLPNGVVEGLNSLSQSGWVAPCPPSGTHHYHFKLYALDRILTIPENSNKADLLQAIKRHLLDSSVLIGLYGR